MKSSLSTKWLMKLSKCKSIIWVFIAVKFRKYRFFTYKITLNCERSLNASLAFLDNTGIIKIKNQKARENTRKRKSSLYLGFFFSLSVSLKNYCSFRQLSIKISSGIFVYLNVVMMFLCPMSFWITSIGVPFL